ncbi:MAG: DUF697 domain-containing protein [Bacteroidota bacterium]
MITQKELNDWKKLFQNWDQEPLGPREQKAAAIVKKNMYWAMGVGLVPVPLLDIAGVTLIQLDMLKELCKCYGVPYSELKGKSILSAIGGAALARYWASIFKAIPVFGSILGGVSMAVTAGATTYALGKVFVNYLRESENLEDIDVAAAKKQFEEELDEGKAMAEQLEAEQAQDVEGQLEQLAKLLEKGLISEEDYKTKKQDILDRM